VKSLAPTSLFSLLTSLVLSQGLAAGLDTLRLLPNERILIIAPHPDDEVLACGGLIQQALALGDSVWVVYVTAGDGSWPSAWKVTGNMLPGTENYLELGRARMEEAKAGAALLGLTRPRLWFLGYPDGDLARMWQQGWFNPIKSAHTGVTADPYNGCSGRMEYSGSGLLAHISGLLKLIRPTRVFGPHPLDAHSDHWSTAMFMAIAREAWRPTVVGPFPDVYCYLIHRPQYPDAQTDEEGFLSPPDDLNGAGDRWFTTSLSDAQLQTKRTALGYYDSQRGTFGNDINGYVTANELFDRIEVAADSVTEDAPQVAFLPAARFSSVQASVEGESLSLRVSLEAEPSPSFDYSFFAHSVDFDADSVIHSGFTLELTPGTSAESQGWSVRMPRSQPFGNGVLLYSAEIRWGSMLLNHSGIGRTTY
jgi:LmbE family N-acetylglucosaminyl deacetylase